MNFSELIQRAIEQVSLRDISPEIVLAASICILFVLDLFIPRPRKKIVAYLSLAAVAAALAVLTHLHMADRWQTSFSGLFVLDPFAVFFKYIFLAAAFLAILISVRYLDIENIHYGEYYPLILSAVLGMMFMASGADLITIYVALELMALSVYVLVGFLKANRRSNEAALKYFVLGAFSSAFFLYGISLFYGVAGTTNLARLQAVIGGAGNNAVAALGLIMLTVGLAFKVAAVPFHMWAPDAYEGAPTSITAFISTAPKAAAFAIFLRIYLNGVFALRAEWTDLLWVLAVATMTFGNIIAVTQTNMKRMLAYSSIAHAGYMLIGIIAADKAGSEVAVGGVLLYALVYMFMNIGAFSMVVLLRRREIVGDELKDFSGLMKRSPVSALVMLIFLLSLAGIPPTAGFIAKLIIFGAAIKAHFFVLAVIAVANTAVSLYYYVRVVVYMFMGDPLETYAYSYSFELVAALVVTLAFTLGIGFYPGPFIELARNSALAIP
jgi:NADH-quinone oxidoreductase subunit N